MGKLNKKLSKKSKTLKLEVVPKKQETEVLLEEVRRSDDTVPKKVNDKNFLKPHVKTN